LSSWARQGGLVTVEHDLAVEAFGLQNEDAGRSYQDVVEVELRAVEIVRDEPAGAHQRLECLGRALLSDGPGEVVADPGRCVSRATT